MSKIISDEFIETLNKMEELGKTRTALLFKDIHAGEVHPDVFIQGNIPLYINRSITEVGKLSYAPKRRVEENSWTEDWSKSPKNMQRMKSKVGRVLNQILPKEFLENYYGDKAMAMDIEKFTSQLKSMFYEETLEEGFTTFDEFSMYEYHNTGWEAREEERGSLGESCMRHSQCVEDGYFDLYDSEDTPVKLLTYQSCSDDDGYIGRALLWDLPEGKFMDRIYYTDDHQIDIFKRWALKNGYTPKTRQSYSQKLKWDKGGDVVEIPLIIPCAHFDDLEHFPYIDTFTYGFVHDEDCYLTNSPKYANEKLGVLKFRQFECTGGGYNTIRGQIVKTIDKDKNTIDTFNFQEQTFHINEFAMRSSSVLNTAGEYLRYTDDGDENIINCNVHIKGYGWESQYFHKSEVQYCYASDSWNPKVSTKEMTDTNDWIMWDYNGTWKEKKTCLKRMLVLDRDGIIRKKSQCVVYYDKNNKPKVFFKDGSDKVVMDEFGVYRLRSEIVLVRLVDRTLQIPIWEVSIIKMLNRRQEQAKNLTLSTNNLNDEQFKLK